MCALVPTTIQLNPPSGYGFLLWACAQQPPLDESYLEQYCVEKGRNYTDFTITTANSWNVRYVPPLGYPGARGGGW
jgi:hypothetical protein